MKPPSLNHIAEVLRSLIRLELSKLAMKHPESCFYGVALDCNVAGGTVFLSANTEKDLREHCLKRYVTPDRTLEQAMSDLKWAFGDWTYYCINAESTEWHEQWQPISEQIETYMFDHYDGEEPDWYEEFLETMCRILITLEKEHAFDVIHRDSDFRLCCADHEESLQEGEERMNRVRISG